MKNIHKTMLLTIMTFVSVASAQKINGVLFENVNTEKSIQTLVGFHSYTQDAMFAVEVPQEVLVNEFDLVSLKTCKVSYRLRLPNGLGSLSFTDTCKLSYREVSRRVPPQPGENITNSYPTYVDYRAGAFAVGSKKSMHKVLARIYEAYINQGKEKIEIQHPYYAISYPGAGYTEKDLGNFVMDMLQVSSIRIAFTSE